ncbi:MAG: hypothetical protein IJS69_04300 [Selenomonadaceae bacterium]|nr:hypothetical protein [Selenomonadaceae bacterium]
MQFGLENLSAIHGAGVKLGVTIALYGAGFSIGKNIVRIFRGKIRAPVAIAHVIRDTAIFFGISYLAGVLSGGAIQMANTASNVSVPKISPTAPSVSVGVVGNSASELSGAAGNLVEQVTKGLFGKISSAGTGVGSALTAATADTPIGGTVAAFVGTFGTMGASLFGDTTAAAIPAVLFGMVIGVIFALIFDK